MEMRNIDNLLEVIKYEIIERDDKILKLKQQLKEKTKQKEVIGDYIRLEGLLGVYSNVLDLTPNGIKKYLETINILK